MIKKRYQSIWHTFIEITTKLNMYNRCLFRDILEYNYSINILKKCFYNSLTKHVDAAFKQYLQGQQVSQLGAANYERHLIK